MIRFVYLYLFSGATLRGRHRPKCLRRPGQPGAPLSAGSVTRWRCLEYLHAPPTACEKCGAQVRNRNERLVMAPSGTSGGVGVGGGVEALAQFLEGQRCLYFIFAPQIDQLSNRDSAMAPAEPPANLEGQIWSHTPPSQGSEEAPDNPRVGFHESRRRPHQAESVCVCVCVCVLKHIYLRGCYLK